MVLVIRDCKKQTIETFDKGKGDGYFACDVFCCPTNKTQTYWVDFVKSMRTKLDNVTEDVNFVESNNNPHIKWWSKIEKYGLFLPQSLVKLYHENVKQYQQLRYQLQHFYQRLNHELKFLQKTSNKHANDHLVRKKRQLFPYGHLFEEFNTLQQERRKTITDNRKHIMACNIPRICSFESHFWSRHTC